MIAKSKAKLIVLIVLVFVAANSIVYYFTELDTKQRIKSSLDENIITLKTHIEIILYNQSQIADDVYARTTKIPRFMEIMSKAQNASLKEKSILRDELYNLLKDEYKNIKSKGVLQYQFMLPNNDVFLRMHYMSKFDDNLTNYREDIKYANETKKQIRGFTQGRSAHGFRNIYPLFDAKGKYFGLMEVSFSSDIFLDYLTSINNIHTHFLVDKNIFHEKSFEKDALLSKYTQSNEHKDFLITRLKAHPKNISILENKERLKAFKNVIDIGIKKGEKFALYVPEEDNSIVAIAFYPIKNIAKTKTVAWFVSYQDSTQIFFLLKTSFVFKTVLFFVFLIIGYLLYRQIIAQRALIQEHKLVYDILSTTDEMIFITDFKTVSYSNRKFRSFFDIKNEEKFNKKTKNNLLNIFVKGEGYLHKGMLKKGDTVTGYFQKTPKDERIVCIFDKTSNPKVFIINLIKISYTDNEDYLVTLTDITTIKEKEAITQEKAYVDGLTGVFNRNKFDEISAKEFSRSKRYNTPLSIAIADIDYFKIFNDTHGHLVGDEILIMLAKNLNNNVRSTDTFARWGGEEFVILFPETSKNDAKIVCDKLRTEIEKLLHPTAGGIKISFGVTQYIDGDTLESMFKRCDDALYEAKNNGRNKVYVK